MGEPSIYTVGGTVQANQNGVYIPRKADEELLALCREHKFAYILTSRQMGKSSLMVRTAEQLAEEGIQSVVIDLTQVGVQVTAEQWYLGLLTIIEGTLMLDTDVVQWWQERSHLGFTQRLTLFFEEVLLKEVASPLVIFIDEIDTTLSLDFTDDFFAAIRYLYNARSQKPEFQRLSFVLIGVATPGDLIRDPKRTPFNIGQRVDLTDFTFEEAKPLAQGLELSTDKAQQVLRWLLEWTGGHPYLSQRLCCIISQQDKKSWLKTDVDRLVNNTFLGAMSQEDNNLQFVRDMLTKRAPDVFDVLTTYREIRRGKHRVFDEEQSLVKSHLKLSGVVRSENKVLYIRNPIYRQMFDDSWVTQNLPVRITKKQLQINLIRGLSVGFVAALMLAGVAWWQWQRALINEIQSISATSEALFASNKRLDALIAALTASQKLKTVGTASTETRTQVELVLKQAIAGADEYNRLSGHADVVRGVAFSPQGNLIATASDDKTVKLWRRDGSLLTTLKGHSAAVYGVAISPDGNTIASASADKTVKLWKLDGTLQTTLKGHSQAVYGVAISPDGQAIASASADKTVKLWKLDGTELTTFIGHSNIVSAVAFSPQGNLIASASWDKTVKLWKRDGSLLTTLKGHSDTVSAVAISPDGQTIASASADNTVKLWKRDGSLRTTITDSSSPVYAVAFSPDGQTIASAHWDKTVKLSNLDGTLLSTLHGHSEFVSGVAYAPSAGSANSPQGSTIASVSGDKTVRFWKLKSTLQTPLKGHSAAVRTVAFSPQSSIIATAGDDKTVKLWKRDGTLLTSLKGHSGRIWGVAFSPDGQAIASASEDKTVRLWKLDGSLINIFKGHGEIVNAVAFSPDGKTIATASDDKTVRLWRRDGSLLQTLNGHNQEVWGVAFSPDGQIIASASPDKTVKLWKRDGSLLQTLKGHNGEVKAVAFSPQGNLIATGSEDKTVKLWKPDGSLITTLRGHSGAVRGVAFSPNGKMIASASDDKTVKLWKPDGTELSTLNGGHSSGVSGVAFSPDGQTIASASEDRTTILWDLDHVLSLEKLLSYSCDWVSDYLRTNAQVQNSVSVASTQDAHHLCAKIDAQ
ncbi:WD-40 repeat-containing protein [Kalymmatonema gypsitolerans NIES-4073]|nr:WD-40 repeat-containing protein [Scytonema sp. NIES-4073]